MGIIAVGKLIIARVWNMFFMRSSWLVVVPLALALAQLVFLANFRALVFDASFYEAELNKLGVYDRLPQAGAVTKEIIMFHQGGRESIDSWPFSQGEIQHLRDVRGVIRQALRYLYLLTFISVVLIAALFLHSPSRRLFFDDVAGAFLLSGSLVLALCFVFVVAAVSFSDSFEGFHRLFFDVGTYSFSGFGSLVDFFPEQFFLDFAARVVAASAVTGIGLLAVSFFVRRLGVRA